MKRSEGWFMALEGGEGAGKSTQVEILLKRLLESGVPAISVHEPGTTPLGLHLRTYLKGKQRIDAGAELLLFGASRAQLMTEVIQPSLKRGISVLADRFAASSIAYQGHGRGIAVDRVQAINDFATGGVYADLNILLDLPPEAGLARTRGERSSRRTRPTTAGSRTSPWNCTGGSARRFWHKPKRSRADGR